MAAKLRVIVYFCLYKIYTTIAQCSTRMLLIMDLGLLTRKEKPAWTLVYSLGKRMYI